MLARGVAHGQHPQSGVQPPLLGCGYWQQLGITHHVSLMQQCTTVARRGPSPSDWAVRKTVASSENSLVSCAAQGIMMLDALHR